MTISRAKIVKGKWSRKVTWGKNRIWRTDMFKSVLDDPRLEIAEFILKDGSTVQIPAQELRRVLIGGPDHYHGQIWGPFNIDPQSKTVNGISVKMTVTP